MFRVMSSCIAADLLAIPWVCFGALPRVYGVGCCMGISEGTFKGSWRYGAVRTS